jgi:hypothetical protein
MTDAVNIASAIIAGLIVALMFAVLTHTPTSLAYRCEALALNGYEATPECKTYWDAINEK